MTPAAPHALPLQGLWATIASATHVAGACAAVTVAVLLWNRRDRFGQAGEAIIAALACNGLWCLATAVEGRAA
jgi:hypothetical protein